MSSLGPLELLIVKFAGQDPSPEVVAALRDLVEAGTIRIVDLVFVRKGDDGTLAWSEGEPSPKPSASPTSPPTSWSSCRKGTWRR